MTSEFTPPPAGTLLPEVEVRPEDFEGAWMVNLSGDRTRFGNLSKVNDIELYGDGVDLEGGNEEVARDIAMHIAALNPAYIDVDDVPADVLETIEYTDVSSLDEPDCSKKDLERCIWLLRHFLRPSEDQEFNEYYIHVTGACGRIGAGIEDAWVDWVSSGHHGQKQHNRDPKRLLSFEGGAGHLSLFSLAKEQDSQWQRRLPLHLAFSIEKAYSEEPMQDPSLII